MSFMSFSIYRSVHPSRMIVATTFSFPPLYCFSLSTCYLVGVIGREVLFLLLLLLLVVVTRFRQRSSLVKQAAAYLEITGLFLEVAGSFPAHRQTFHLLPVDKEKWPWGGKGFCHNCNLTWRRDQLPLRRSTFTARRWQWTFVKSSSCLSSVRNVRLSQKKKERGEDRNCALIFWRINVNVVCIRAYGLFQRDSSSSIQIEIFYYTLVVKRLINTSIIHLNA